MVVISKAYYNKITAASTAKKLSVVTPAVVAPKIDYTAKSIAGDYSQSRVNAEEEARKALIASQQRLAEQSAALNQFSVDDNADVAKKSLFAEEAAQSSKQVTADFATLKTYVIPKKYADIKRGTTPIETWNANIDSGRLQQDTSKARAVALSDPTPENTKLADTLGKTYDAYVAKNRDAFYYTDANGVEKARGNVITRVFANYVPQLVDQIVANIPAIALSVGAGLLTGGAYTAAEIAAMTTTQLAARAAAIGLTSNVVGQGASAIAGWNQSYDVTRGAAYDNLISLGVPADRAKEISANEAFWSSLIEMSDNVLDWSLLGFGKVAGAITQLGTGVAADIVAKTGKEVVVKSAMRKMVDVLAKYGVNILSEGSQEWVQEGLSIQSEKTGLGAARTATAAEDLQRQNLAFQGGAQIAAITGGAALAGTNIATNMINRVNQDTSTTPTSKPTIAPVVNTGNNATVTTPVTTLPLANTITPKVVENPSEGKIEGVNTQIEKITNEVVGSSKNQTDLVMSAVVGGKVVGTIEYSEYEGQPNIQMIKVNKESQRQGIATQLLQNLQKEYPKTEIEWGNTTADGTALKEKVTVTKENKTYTSLKKEYLQAEKTLKEIEAMMDNGDDSRGDEWNTVYDRSRELEKKLNDMKPSTTWIKPPIVAPTVSPAILEKISIAKTEALETEFFGSKTPKMNLQLFAEKFKAAQAKIAENFTKEKDRLSRRFTSPMQSQLLDTLSKKYDAKIDSLNSMLDSEKYTNFWTNELDKKELRGRIDTLRADKNTQIDQMKKAFSEKLKTTKKQATLNKATAISKLKGVYAANKKESQVKVAERKEINKKLSDLRKVDMKHMRPEYQKPIQAIFDAFDIKSKTHTTRKLASLNALQRYISENTEHSIPDYKLKELELLSKKTVSQITKEEFDSIYTAVMHLVKLEKLKDQLIMNGRYRSNSEAVAEGASNVTKGRQVKTDPLMVDTNKPEYSKNMFANVKEFFLNHFTPETFVLMSDQKQHGIIKKIVFDNMYAGYSNVLDFKQQADKIFSPFLKGLGGDLRNWSRSINKNIKSSELVEIPISKQPNQTIQKIRVTKAERIYLYLGSFNTDIRRSMLKGGVSFKNNLSQIIHLTEADIDTINNSLTADEKKFADLTKQYFKWAGVKINEVFLELNGYELIQSDKQYLPEAVHPDMIQRDFLKMRNKSVNASIEGIGFLKEKTNHAKAIVVDDIFRVIIEHMEAISAYYGYAAPLRNAKMLLGDPNLKNAYRRVGMNNVLTQLNNYISDIEQKSVDMDFVEKLGYSIQNKFSTAALGANPFTIMKQPSSYILEANEVPVQYLLKAIATKSTLDEIRKYSPILTDRIDGNVSMEMGDIGKIARVRELFGNYKDIPQALTKGISAADRMIVGKTWNAVKMMLRAENPNITQEELMTKTARRVEEVIRHTNSAATMHDRSSIGRSRSLFTRAITIFTSQTNVMLNSATQAMLELNNSNHTTKDFATATKKLVTIYLLANLFEQSIDQFRRKVKGQDDKPWNIPMDIIGGMLDQIYFVGKAFKVYQSKVEYGKYFGYDFSIPQMQLVEQLLNYATDITTMVEQKATQEVYKSGDKKGSLKWQETLKSITNETFSIMSKLYGLPYDSVQGLIDSQLNKQ